MRDRPDGHDSPDTGKRTLARLIIGKALLLAGLALAAQAAPAHGQSAAGDSPHEVREGTAIRITAPSLRLDRTEAVVRSVTDSTIVVEWADAERSGTRLIDRARISELEVRTGRERKPLKGLAVGAGVGGGAGFLLGFAAEATDDNDSPLQFNPVAVGAAGAVVLGVAGGVIGLVIGSVGQFDTWTAVSPEGASVDVAPVVSDEGIGAGIRISLPIGR